jgi:hypothetical protein
MIFRLSAYFNSTKPVVFTEFSLALFWWVILALFSELPRFKDSPKNVKKKGF